MPYKSRASIKMAGNTSIEFTETPRLPDDEEVVAFQAALKGAIRRLAARNDDVTLRMDPTLKRLEKAAETELVAERKRWNRITDATAASAVSATRVAVEVDCFARDGLSLQNPVARVYRLLLTEEFQKALVSRDLNRITTQIATELAFAGIVEGGKKRIKQVLSCVWE